jgi:CBS domain containing-hemolysin-like protein
MKTGDIIQIIFLVVCILLSAFFSSAETALTTSNRIRMRTLAENGDKRAAKVLALTSNSGKMLSAILIGNNVVNLSASSMATALALRLLGSVGAGIATGVLTLLILIFGEISPKTIATIHADEIALAYAGIIDVILKIFTPVIFLVNVLTGLFLRLLRIDPNAQKRILTETELRTIVDVSHESGVIESEEHEMINNVFDFTDSVAKEIMIPRIDMTFVSVHASYTEVLDTYRETHYTRFPVYEESSDNIIGILNIKDLLLCDGPDTFSIADIMRKPFFTYEHKNTAELFSQMQESSINVAVVLNEYGSTAGLVTLEDLLEEIVGEIHDEYDYNEEDDVFAINEHEYLVVGSMNLEDLCDYLDIHLESEDYDSIGGYLLGLLDHLPEEGESIVAPDGTVLRVDKMDKNRIEKVYLKLTEKENEES